MVSLKGLHTQYKNPLYYYYIKYNHTYISAVANERIDYIVAGHCSFDIIIL